MNADAYSPEPESVALLDHLARARAELPSTEDLLALCMPLLRQVAERHAAGLVAPLSGIAALRVTSGKIWFESARAHPPRLAAEALAAAERDARDAPLEVIAHHRHTHQDGAASIEDLRIGEPGSAPGQPRYLPGFVSWEHELGHHDPRSDVFVLGLLLAALATGLDLTRTDGLRSFVATRDDLCCANPALHPVAALVIARMTELDRHRREPDLARAITMLERRREQDALQAFDLSQFRSFVASAVEGRREVILSHLQDRLHDRSRRNRLLYFRPTHGSLNLTAGSVPLLLDYRNLDPDALVTWNGGDFSQQVVSQKPLALARWLRFEDYPYIAPTLDRIRLDAARDVAEYGFSQLRLVVCFLHWHDLKNARDERISSPLLLLPVRLARKKGVRDAHALEASSELAEINPVLRLHLRELYGLALPESVDLSEPGAIEELHRALSEQITASEPAVVLEKLERPRIELVQAIARRRLEQHQRRARLAGRGVRSLHGLDYAYGRERRAPLGIQLFTHVVSPSEAPQRDLLEDPRPRVLKLGPELREVRREQYRLHDASGPGNPLRWSFDLCSVTLANFNYRKMALVGDYAALLRQPTSSPVFEILFPREARPLAPEVASPSLDQLYCVVPADPTQQQAIALARSGTSFIVQGPPGTGKSQTIANLIADYLARGQRVLFVCAKRAAIDVVYHRLQQQGLARLCCMIHDSQQDKRSFVADLKQSYEAWIDAARETAGARARQAALTRITAEQRRLEQFALEMTAPASGSSAPLVRVMRRCVELCPGSTPPALSPAARGALPEHRLFQEHAASLVRIGDDLRRIGHDPILAKHPARLLRSGALADPQAQAALREQLSESRASLEVLAASQQEAAEPLALSRERARLARSLLPLARARLLPLLRAGGELYQRVQRGVFELRRRLHALATARDEARGWREPLRRDETEAALVLAQRHSRNPFRFLFPGFWRLRRVLHQRFDFAQAALRPSFVTVLERLLAHHEAEHRAAEQRLELASDTGVEDVVPLFDVAAELEARPLGADLLRFRDELLQSPDGAVGRLQQLAQFAQVADALDLSLVHWQELTPAALLEALSTLDRDFERLPDLLPILARVDALPGALAAAVRRLELDVPGLEAAVCQAAVQASAGARRGDVTGATVESVHASLVRDHLALQRANATSILEQVRARFQEHVELSSRPAAGLTPEQKPFKKAYAAGRKELEHEFGKVMRFRPIRDLVSGAPGTVVRDLKPVWLMSPLSIADALPLDAEFDVAIVDEASQIPLEDAIPALERGRQIIIVGDDKQLPPTAFFAARATDDTDEGEDTDTDLVALDADSLLDHSARALPATMLAWHYRSRDEALISFCNQAFYQGRLRTAPSLQLPVASPEIRASSAEAGVPGAVAALSRSLSFHRIEGARYAERRNPAEAAYIAQMLRELLRRPTGLSLGVVAFSQAQQDEIERAIRTLCDQDASFRAAYEAELEREDEGQFTGLFVKNLENVQGDERDLIILSVCYGPDAAGKLAMNFGPINQRGGERRLNVVFSRARKHMAVVSSIDWSQITNDYNDGAACLKGYLRYAAAVSRGDMQDAGAVLDQLARTRGAGAAQPCADPVAAELARALTERGWQADLNVGASEFRCDVAVRAEADAHYRLGILIDSDAHYTSDDIDDRFRLKPAILQAFGWQVHWVLTRDWLLDREGVIARIEAACAHPQRGT